MRTSRVWEFKPCTLWQLKTKSASELHFVFIEGERSESVTSSWIHTRQKMSCSGQAPFSSDKNIASSSSQRSKPVKNLPDRFLGILQLWDGSKPSQQICHLPCCKRQGKRGWNKKNLLSQVNHMCYNGFLKTTGVLSCGRKPSSAQCTAEEE